jgi:hypothetical protein
MKRLMLCMLGAFALGCSNDRDSIAPMETLATDIAPGEDISSVIIVRNLDDAGEGSLRWALDQVPSGGTVRFKTGLTGSVLLRTGQLVIDKAMTLRGPGADQLELRREEGVGRVLYVGEAGLTTVSGLTIAGGQTTIESNDQRNGGGIWNDGDLTLHDCVVKENSAHLSGGGVYNVGKLELRGSLIINNRARHGPGAGISNSGTLLLNRTTISSNTGIDESGGAGIWSGGLLILRNSTISGNVSRRHPGGGLWSNGESYIDNTTISGNTAFSGGGIAVYGGQMTITGSTIVGNTARQSISNGIENRAELELYNTIVALNGSPDDFSPGVDMTSSGTIKTAHSIIAFPIMPDPFCACSPSVLLTEDIGGNIFSVTAGELAVGPLANNGGPTETHALLAGSVAIDRGKGLYATTKWDQRGSPFARRAGLRPDIGAFEFQDPPQ